MGKEAADDGCLALGGAHVRAVALLARNLPFGLGLLGSGLGESQECSAFRPRMFGMKAFWPLACPR